MKYLFLLIAILFNSMHLFSQCISVELSIHWEREKNPFSLNENDFCVPYLHITYRNNSDDTLYFLKVSYSENNFPNFVGGIIMVRNNTINELSKFKNYSNIKYSIRLKSFPYYLTGWEVLEDTLDPNKAHTVSFINYDLSDIYDYLSKNNSDSIYEIKFDYEVSDITPDAILNKFKDRFVFLRPGEIYTDTYNLVGFKLLKGSYTFYTEPNSFPDYVHTSIYDTNNSKYLDIQTALPKVVSVYKLYSGNFNSNRITITF